MEETYKEQSQKECKKSRKEFAEKGCKKSCDELGKMGCKRSNKEPSMEENYQGTRVQSM